MKSSAHSQDPFHDELAARRPSSIIEAKIRSEIRRDLEMMVQFAGKLGVRTSK